MSEEFSTAFMLLAVGMITVITILSLIVFFGNMLVLFVNNYFPELKVKTAISSVTNGSFDLRKMAAIVSAVDVASKGKAKVTSITKVK